MIIKELFDWMLILCSSRGCHLEVVTLELFIIEIRYNKFELTS